MEGCMGEESFQMWELNRRLEAYLSRVKALEEQNELLSAELGGLRAQSGDTSWRARADDELAALRALVDQRWREKHAAEVARDNLAEELEGVAGRCQQVRLARERTAEEAARSRRAVEAEKCAQAWLSSQAKELERELEAVRAAHEEERAGLNAQAACTPRGPAPPRGPPAPAPEVEELARRLGEAWRGAVRGYQERVAHMETSLGQARERLGRAVQGAREGRLELQQLQTERGGLQERRAALEQRLEGRWQERLRATEKFQLAVEALEQEKQGLQSQIAQILEGRQQLAHLKMSLSLEVATYRTLLEAENSRLQTPIGGGSKASLSFQDPKLELRFPGTPEGRRPGPLLPVLSPAPLPSPLPETLETPVPAFLKSQEFLQARIPTLASTPIPPTSQAPCPATDAEIKAQAAPVSLAQPQDERQQAPEPQWAEVKEAVPASVLPGPEEPGGRQREPSAGQVPEQQASSSLPLSCSHPSLEVKDEEPNGSRVPSVFQEEGKGQTWGLVEEETAREVKMVSSLQQETWREEDLDMKEIQDSHSPLEKETLRALGKEIQEPLENQNHETLEKENQEPLRSSEDETLETPKSLENVTQELAKSLEEKDVELVRPLEQETLELLKPMEKEDSETLQALEKEGQGLVMSLEENIETFLFPEKENQELVRSLEEENIESLRSLEEENQEPLSFKEEDQELLRPLAKENQESLKAFEDENQEPFRELEEENQEPLKSLEEDQKIMRPLEKETLEPLRSLEEEDQETLRPLEKETQPPLRFLAEEDQMTLTPLEERNPEPLKSPGEDQEIVRALTNENPELLESLEKESAEVVRSLETENLESLMFAEGNPEILKSLETQETLWSLEEVNPGTKKPLEKGIQEPQGSAEENQGTPRPLEKDSQEPLSSLGEWSLENLRSSEEVEKESEENLGEEENPEKGKDQELPRPREEGREQPLWVNGQSGEDVVGDQDPGQEPCPRRPGVGNEDEAELSLRMCDGLSDGLSDGFGKEAAEPGEPQPSAAWEGQSWSPEPAEGSSGKGGAEGLQDSEKQAEQVGAPDPQAPQGMAEVKGPPLDDENAAPGGDRASPVVTLGSETTVEESVVGAKQGLEQEAGGLGQSLGEESLEAKMVQGLGGPGEDLEEAGALQTEFSKLARTESEPEASGRDGEASTQLGARSPKPPEPWPPSPVLEEAPRPQPQVEGNQEAEGEEEAPGPQPQVEGRQEAGELEGRAKGKVEGELGELGSGEIPEGLQEEGEESREESEADELGETLPDSTPLGFYLRSPSSPKWDLAGEQRPSHQGETPKEGWDPAILAPKDLAAQPSEEEAGNREEGCGPDSDLSEEFEDLGTEASLLPRVPREVTEPLGQVPQLLLEPAAAWDGDGESDGFADEEESGEEDEEGEEPGAGQWGPASSAGSLQALSSPQRGELESGTRGVSVPWDDGSGGAAADTPGTALETESQDSTEPSGSEGESDPSPLEREDQVPGPLETPSGADDMGPEDRDTLGVNGQGPSSDEELGQVDGAVVNGLRQSKGERQGRLGAPEGDQGSPLQEDGAALKTPWAGAALHLDPGQFPRFTQREGDGDSWSSGED